MEQGNIVSWHVSEGDEVSAGTVLADIETDKATLAFENQDEGYVSDDSALISGEGSHTSPCALPAPRAKDCVWY